MRTTPIFLRWFVDPGSGEVVPWSEDPDEPCPEDGGAYYVEPLPSWEAYEDLQDFVARVPERRPADLLARAIEGRGAFRRFKDTLFEFLDRREAWFNLHDVRMRRRRSSGCETPAWSRKPRPKPPSLGSRIL